MSFVASTKRTSSRARQQLEIQIWIGWGLALAAMEYFGRRSKSDFEDAWGAALLLGLVLFTWRYHQHRPLKLVTKGQVLLQRIVSARRHYRVQAGVDFRGKPAIEPGFPRHFALLTAVCWIGVGALWLTRAVFPGDLRELGLNVSAALTLVLTTVVWAGLVMGSLALVALIAVLIHLAFQKIPKRRLGRGWQVWTTLVYYSLVLIAGLLLPVWVPLVWVVALGLFQAALVSLPRHPNLAILWRGHSIPARSSSWKHWVLWQEWTLAGIFAAVAVLTYGDRVFLTTVSNTPVTSGLGICFSWVAAGVTLPSTLLHLSFCWNGWFRNPSHPTRTRVLLDGAQEPTVIATARRTLEPRFQLDRVPASKSNEQVRIRIVPQDATPDWSPFARTFPLEVSLAQLAQRETQDRLWRRHQIQLRRLFFRGLRKILREAKTRKYQRGLGFWLGPQHWFIDGIGRDQDEEDTIGDVVGPVFHQVMPLAARRHFHRVATATGVDLVFVEDGIRVRQVERVLRTLFEVYDIHGGEQEIQERHFVGIPQVKVILHDFGPVSPFQSKVYPEPDTDEIGRARILHVFKDRGDAFENVSDPADSDAVPSSPQLVGV